MVKDKIFLVLDNIRSRENVGSIFRTADAIGVEEIFLCGITPGPPHPKIAKVSLGAETNVPWKYHKQTWKLLDKLKSGGARLVALEQTKDSINIFNSKIPTQVPIALVVGNEVKGVSKAALKKCDTKIYIPMRGKKESLNVSVATGVALYQILKNIL